MGPGAENVLHTDMRFKDKCGIRGGNRHYCRALKSKEDYMGPFLSAEDCRAY